MVPVKGETMTEYIARLFASRLGVNDNDGRAWTSTLTGRVSSPWVGRRNVAKCLCI